MAHQHTPPEMSQKTEYLEPDDESDRDSGVDEDAGEDADGCHKNNAAESDKIVEQDDFEEDNNAPGEGQDFTVFVAFQGNMEDEDFIQKLDTVLSGIPNALDMG